VRYVKDSPLELGHRAWQLRPPAPSLTVLVKGTFDPAAGDPAPFAAEPVPVTGEVFVEDDAQNAQRVPTDFALLKPRGECFVIGKAWAPGGRPTPTVACSFRVGSIEKSFVVFGDRRWTGSLVKSISQPEPFTSMDLSMDRAFGGRGHAQNPWGRGCVEIAGELPLPNLEQARALINAPNSRPDPVVLGPLPMVWPERAKLAGTYDQRYMRERWPWLPRDLDWRFFLEAPRDQQLADGFWRGDERIEIQNLHPEVPSIRSHLPGIAPRAFIDLTRPGQGPSFEEVSLKLDTVVWDAEIGKLILVWRGMVEVPSDTLDEVRHIYVHHEPLAGPFARPSAHQARMEALLGAEGAEEREAEGEPPPAFEVAPAIAQMPAAEERAEEEPEPTEEERELEAQLSAMSARLEAMGMKAPPADEPPPALPDPMALLEKLRASGAPIPPDLEEALRSLDTPEPEPEPRAEVPPESPPVLDGRALVLALIEQGQPLTKLDLTGADLSALNLERQDLSGNLMKNVSLAGAKLAGANLSGVVLSESELVRADLKGANLSGADLTRANLQWADLTDAVLEDATLEEARLVAARMAGVSAAGASFVRADLTEAVLAKGRFKEADFERARLDRADAREAIFESAVLEDATATGARFDHAVMTKARCAGLRAKEAHFGSIDAVDSFWERSDLTRANFALSKLTRADFTEAVVIAAEMDGCALRQARFDRAKAHSLKARKADLMEAMFDSADLSFADLRGASLFGAEFWRANTKDVQLHLANVTRTKLEGQGR